MNDAHPLMRSPNQSPFFLMTYYVIYVNDASDPIYASDYDYDHGPLVTEI